MDLTKWIQCLGFMVLSNDRQVIAPLELDLYLPDQKLAIEYDGLYWHGERLRGKEALRRTQEKVARCAAMGIRLVVIFEDEWLTRQEAVRGYLTAILGIKGRRVGARECRVVLDHPGVKAFTDQHHLQGGSHGVHVALQGPGEGVLASMTFARPNASRARRTTPGVWELARFCVAPGVSVPGGASKLLQVFLREHPDCTQVISYSDNRWSQGGLYRRLGFKKETSGVPGYWYFKSGTSGPREHRYKYRKQQALKRFGGDPSMTEWQVMQQAGWDRIWDLGAARWVLETPPNLHP